MSCHIGHGGRAGDESAYKHRVEKLQLVNPRGDDVAACIPVGGGTRGAVHELMISPPCTLPAAFAWLGSIVWLIVIVVRLSIVALL
jgi:hypothetical protein